MEASLKKKKKFRNTKICVQLTWLYASPNYAWETIYKIMNWNNNAPPNASSKACSLCFIYFKTTGV